MGSKLFASKYLSLLNTNIINITILYMKLDDKMIEKMSKRLAEIAKNRKSTYQTEQQKSNVKDNYKEEMLPFSRTSEI